MNNRINCRRVLVLLLVGSMILSLCGCGLNVGDLADSAGQHISNATKATLSKTGQFLNDAQGKIINAYGSVKNGVVYAYDEAAELTAVGYEKASAKSEEIIGDVSEYISALNTQEPVSAAGYAKGDPNRPVKDLPNGVSFNEIGAISIGKHYDTEQFIAYYISSILDARGYQVLNGAVYYKGETYGGLIFTKGDAFIDDDGQKILSCGFIQLVSDDYDGVVITDTMVQTGLIAVSSGSYGTTTEAFVVEEYTVIDDFSGIYNDTYFCLRQIDHYVLSISIKENKSANYDSKVELYDFDNEKYIYYAGKEEEVQRLYTEDKEVFQGAATTVNAIVDVEENSMDELATVFIMDGNALDALLMKGSSGTEAVVDYMTSAVKGTKLTDNQFLSVDSNGKVHVLGSETEVDETRLTNGIITTVSSGLAAAGAVASIICVAHAGGFVVTAIVITTGTSAIVYNISNMISGSQDVYYGAKGDVKESENPVLNLFKMAIPDEQTATLVYHIWGASNTIISGLMMPITKALNIAKVRSLNTFQTSISVIRASLTSIAKVAVTGIGAGFVANYVSKVVSKVTNNGNLGRLAGFGTCLVAGFLIYKGLDAVDRRLDISGLYPKETVKASFQNERNDQKRYLYKDTVSSNSQGEDEAKVNALVNEAKEYFHLDTKPDVKIVYDSDKYSYGSYDPDTNTLTVNMLADGHNTTGELANTIGHEMKHYVQEQEAIANPNGEMAHSLNNYICCEPDMSNYNDYRNQLCEADAFAAGDEFENYILNMWAA